MDATDDQPKRKRPTFRQEARKKPKADDDAQKGHFSGFGAKMMAKMGYKTGSGLGKEGDGIAEPIQVQLRPTKVGLGAVKEKSDQQKRDERRRKEAAGEKYEDSSEEEKRAPRWKKAAAGASGASTPGAASTPRPKRTIVSIEKSIEDAGIHIPQVLIDAATGESTNVSALSLRGAGVPFQTAMAAKVQRELVAFGDAVAANSSEREYIENEMERLNAEMEALDIQMMELCDISSRLQALRVEKDWAGIVKGLTSLQQAYPSKSLDKEAVAIVHPLLVQSLSNWDPLSGDTLADVAKAFKEMRSIMDPSSRTNQHSFETVRNSQKRSTPYESLMLLLYQQFHMALLKLDPTDDASSLFLEEWKQWEPVLPRFLIRRASREMEQKVSAALEAYNPNMSMKKKAMSPLPSWIFQWLPYCNVWSGVLKSKISTLFKIYPLEKCVIPGIALWKSAFPAEMEKLLINVILPRLAKHLAKFEIDPSNQSLDALNEVLAWNGVLKPRIIAELIHVEFFEKNFYPVLRDWLAYEGRNFDEISQWIRWWQEEVLSCLADIPIHQSDWNAAYNLINTALDLESEGKTLDSLELPVAEPVQPATPTTPNFSKSVNTEPPRSARQEVTELSFKDIVESWCAEEDLLLIPLRKADEATGFPLFRLTASASGKGGVVIYFKGDVVYVQNKKEKSVWDPAGLDEGLVSKAEGN